MRPIKVAIGLAWLALLAAHNESMAAVHVSRIQDGGRPPTISEVGYPARIEQLLLPGKELVARPIESRGEKLVVRVVDRFAHGDGFRYDLEFTGFEFGLYDLRDYLVRKDGSSIEDLPSIPVEIRTLLPPGQVLPHELAPTTPVVLGWYSAVLVGGGGLWLMGLLGILFFGRGRWRRVEVRRHRLSVADRLKPLLERAAAGKISIDERADLERVLLAFWRKKLRLDAVAPQIVITEMKKDPLASRLLLQLENWLHNPEFDGAVDWNELLVPYREMPIEELGS